MTIDMTVQLTPILWGLDVAMIVSGLALLAAVLRAELRHGQRRPQVRRKPGAAGFPISAARPARC